MSIVRNLEWALGGVLLALVAFLAVNAGFTRWSADRVQEKYQAASGDARAAEAYVAVHKAVHKERSEKNAEVETVLARERDWSDAPVPDDVAGLLRNREGTTRAVP